MLPKAEPLMGFGMRSANDCDDRNPSKFDVYYKNLTNNITGEWEKVLSVNSNYRRGNPFNGPWDIVTYPFPSTILA